jgi:hypothetical protein
MILEGLVHEWVNLYKQSIDVDLNQFELLHHKIEKILVSMIQIISNNSIPNDLIQIFSEIIVCYIDHLSFEERQFSELSNMFNQMNISPNNLIDQFGSMMI